MSNDTKHLSYSCLSYSILIGELSLFVIANFLIRLFVYYYC